MKFQIIKNSKIWFAVSGALLIGSILLWIAIGPKTGIDFTGGSLLEVRYENTTRPSQDEIVNVMNDLSLPVSISTAGEQGYILRMKEVDETTHQKILTQLRSKIESQETAQVTEVQFNSIGPVIGKELTQKSVKAIFLVLLAIALYVAYSFRKVSYPIKSWKYGIIAIIALFHDIIITIGFFTIAGMLWGWEASTAFIAALLTILGYSVNDTIVVFDRIRENLSKVSGDFEDVVEKSVQQTALRSVATSLTTMLALVAVFFFGGSTIRPFVATLLAGIFFGTYSSIFIASPLLVLWQKIEGRLRK
jgi:preprotein translocase subunit SecF